MKEVTAGTDGAAVTVEIGHFHTGKVITAIVTEAAAEARTEAVEVTGGEATVQNTGMTVAKDHAAVRNVAAEDVAEPLKRKLKARSLCQNLKLAPLVMRTYLFLMV